MAERRQSSRFVVNSPLVVSLGGGEAGLLFDVGEGGLAIRGLIPERRQDPISVAFHLTDENDPVYAWVRIAWMSNSKNRTGLHFVKMAERTRQRLNAWLRSKLGTTNLCTAGGPSDVINLPGMDPTVISMPAQTESGSRSVGDVASEIPGRWNQLHSKLTFFVALAMSCPAFFVLGHYLPRIMASQKLPGVVVAPPIGEAPSRSKTESPAQKLVALPPRLDLDKPGFVLQVAAMSEEDHADAMAAALNEKKFPAFTYKHSSDRFYRVAVGPYPDLSSSNQVKDELQRENYEVLLRRWSP
jgi:SPOR domain/PilZ domain